MKENEKRRCIFRSNKLMVYFIIMSSLLALLLTTSCRFSEKQEVHSTKAEPLPVSANSNEISENNRQYLSDWIDAHSQPAEEYVLGLYDKHQVVIYGEEHNVKEHKDFVINLIPRLYHEANVRVIAWEFSKSKFNEQLDELITANEYDGQAVIEFARKNQRAWNSKEHWDIIKAVWELNNSLEEGQEKIRMIGLMPDYDDVKAITAMAEKGPDSPEFMELLEEMRTVDLAMAEQVRDQMIAKNCKGFVFVGTGHDFTHYHFPSEVTLGRKFTPMGNHLHEWFGDRVFQVEPTNSLTPSIVELAAADRVSQKIGFDVVNSPFADINAKMGTVMGKTVPDVHWVDRARGYIHLGKNSDFHANTTIKSFVTPSMFKEYKKIYEIENGKKFETAEDVDEYLQKHRWPQP